MIRIGAGHDRVPAETERDQLPNCQWTTWGRQPCDCRPRWGKFSRIARQVNCPTGFCEKFFSLAVFRPSAELFCTV